jgi:ABC-type multidrug transport system fused ATPase/permease subunit
MLRPKKAKTEKIKLTKEGIQKAKGIFSYMKPYAGTFALGWIFLVLSTTTGLIFPYLMGQLLGNSSASLGGMSQIAGQAPEMLLGIFDLKNINHVALTLFILFALQSIFSFFRVVLFTNVTENTLRDVRYAAYKKLIHMPMDFFNKNRVGDLTSRVSADITQVSEAMRTVIAELFRQIIIVVGAVVLLGMISFKLCLIMLATVPVMALVAVFFGRFIKKLSKEAQDRTADANVVLEQNLTGIGNVKIFTNEIYTLNKYKSLIDEVKKLSIKSGLWRGLFTSFIIFCVFGAIVFVIWQGMLLTKGPNPEITSEQFVTFLLYTVMMGTSIGSLPEMYATMQKATGATENLMTIIEDKSENDLFSGKNTAVLSGAFRFNNVTFEYPQREDVEVLKNVDFDVEAGKTIAVVGGSGGGKSTIASLLVRFYEVEKGSITFDDIDIKELNVTHLREHIAVVPQEVMLFGGSIAENIAFGNIKATAQDIETAAKQANAFDFISSFPEGMQTQVGDRGIQLSGGQKQRIAIARAILKNPKILILDEATSALDSESENLVQNALDTLMKGRTSLVIAHRLSTIKNADKILVIQQGEIVETGTHESLIATADSAYGKMVALQNMAMEV